MKRVEANSTARDRSALECDSFIIGVGIKCSVKNLHGETRRLECGVHHVTFGIFH